MGLCKIMLEMPEGEIMSDHEEYCEACDEYVCVCICIHGDPGLCDECYELRLEQNQGAHSVIPA